MNALARFVAGAFAVVVGFQAPVLAGAADAPIGESAASYSRFVADAEDDAGALRYHGLGASVSLDYQGHDFLEISHVGVPLITDEQRKNYSIGSANVKVFARFTTATFTKNLLRSYGGPVRASVYELPLRGSAVTELSSSATKFKESLDYVIQSETDLELKEPAGRTLAPGIVRALGSLEERTFLNTHGRLADGWAVGATVRRQCVISLDLVGLDKSVRDALTAGLEVGVPKVIGGTSELTGINGNLRIGGTAALDAKGDSRGLKAFYKQRAKLVGRDGALEGAITVSDFSKIIAAVKQAMGGRSDQGEVVRLKLLPVNRLAGALPGGTTGDYEGIRDRHVRLRKAERDLSDLTELLADIRTGHIEADLFKIEKAEQAAVAATNAMTALQTLPLTNAMNTPEFREVDETLDRLEGALRELNELSVKVSVNMQLDLPAITPKPIDLKPGNVRARAVLSLPKIEGDRLAIREGLDGTASFMAYLVDGQQGWGPDQANNKTLVATTVGMRELLAPFRGLPINGITRQDGTLLDGAEIQFESEPEHRISYSGAGKPLTPKQTVALGDAAYARVLIDEKVWNKEPRRTYTMTAFASCTVRVSGTTTLRELVKYANDFDSP